MYVDYVNMFRAPVVFSFLGWVGLVFSCSVALIFPSMNRTGGCGICFYSRIDLSGGAVRLGFRFVFGFSVLRRSHALAATRLDDAWYLHGAQAQFPSSISTNNNEGMARRRKIYERHDNEKLVVAYNS